MHFVKLGIILGVLAFIPHEIYAQIVVEESVKTDSIDVFAGAQTSRPSLTLPVLATVVMPGLGHQMLKKEKRAIAYLSADALMIFGMIFFETNARAIYANAKTFAYTYAGAQGGPGADDAYWSNVSKYMDSNGLDAAVAGYNQTQEISRAFDQKYLADNLQWRWWEDDKRKEFGKMLSNSTQFHVAATFCFSALLANRIISLIDLRAASRQGAVVGHAAAPSLRFLPYVNLQRSESGLVLATNF